MKRLALLSILAASTVFAQTATSEFQLWNAVMATPQLGKDTPAFSLWFDGHARRGPDNTVLIVRPGVGVQVLPWLSVWGGYAWVPTMADGVDDVVNEHRAWQQVLLQTETSFRLNLQSRTRVEERFHERGGEVGVRLRQFFRVSWRPSVDVPIGALVSDELFIGLNSTVWGQPAGIDQNRLFVGPFFQLTPWARIEAGYLFVYLDRANDRLLHNVSVLAVFNPRF